MAVKVESMGFSKTAACAIGIWAALASGYAGTAAAGQLTVAWDPVSGAAGYRVYYGTTSGTTSGIYSTNVDAGSQTTSTVQGLADGGTYYFAVQAYNGTTTSGYSNEVSGRVPVAAPVASFTASPTSGTAPLTVTFVDASTGSVTSRSWNMGDGTTATSATVVDTYASPGTYSVTLTVTGSGGSNSANKTITVTAPSTSGTTGGGTTSGGTGATGGGTTSSTSGTGTSSTGTSTTTGSTATTGTTNTTGNTGTSSTATPSVTGLVAAYGFEESSGSTVRDASGSGNVGRIYGAKRVATSQFGRALAFDGLTNWVTIADTPSLDLTAGATLEAWVYPTKPLSGWVSAILKERNGGLAYSLYANSDTGRPSNVVNVDGSDRTLYAGPAPTVNKWTHLAATYDGMNQKLYVNGALVGSRPQTKAMTVSGAPLRIGGNSVWGEFFAGYIDEVRVYNRALSDSEIARDAKRAVVNLMVSTSATRSGAVPLAGQPVSGNIYVFYTHISPDASTNPVKQVRFWLDDPNPGNPTGAPRIVEQLSPYDLAGTMSDGAAAALNTAGLGSGIHTVTAQVTLADGTILPFMTGRFTVQ
jgi:PKD repeat protein